MATFADRVEDTTTTTGTGDITLNDTPPNGRVSFNTAFGFGGVEAPRFAYVIQSADETQWETGIGYLSTSTTLVRETVEGSSNGGNLVPFSTGTKKVFATLLGTQVRRLYSGARNLLIGRGNFLP
jgi:hypothetical protein